MMIKHKAKLAALLVSITTSGIVGCGGESNSFPELVSISITGTAVKGTLGNTLIVACLATSSDCVSADASTVESTSGFLGQDTTDANGIYKITMPQMAWNTPILLRSLANNSTSMECDFTACEDSGFSLDGLELSTIHFVTKPSTFGQTASANVNALTTLAADSLLESVNISEITTANAFSQQSRLVSVAVKEMLGFSNLPNTLNLFELDIPAATTSSLKNASSIDNSVSPSAVQQLSLVNAAIGNVADYGAGETLAEAMQEVRTLVRTTARGLIANDTTSELSGSQLIDFIFTLARIQTEVTSRTTAVQGSLEENFEDIVLPTDPGELTTALSNAANLIDDIQAGGDGNIENTDDNDAGNNDGDNNGGGDDNPATGATGGSGGAD